MTEQPALFEVPIAVRRLGPIEKAIVRGDDIEAIDAVLAKCARTMDECESARDIKALSITIIDGIARRRELGGGKEPSAADVTPIEDIIAERARRFGA